MMKFKIKSVNEMSVDELIGQVIMIGLPYTYLDEDYKEFIKKYKIGNFILFARNYNDTKQMKSFMKELYEYTDKITDSFPLVSIDQEGGMVVRLFKDVTFPASPLTTSATTVTDAPYITGKIIGKDMLSMGINLNLAPCLEINHNLENPLVNVRGYGATKEIVLENSSKFVHGMQASGALSCLKHFPGAGSSTKDTHLEMCVVDESKENLINYNMYPFLHLLDSDSLMSSHCIYSSFDSLPTTLSYEMLTKFVRKEIGFKGLIISDGMEMNAIKDEYGIGEGSVMALNAGCDILLLCHEYDDQKASFDAVKKAVEDGRLSIDLLKEKVERINKAKEKVLNGLITNFKEEDYVINKEEHDLMQEIVDESYTQILGNKPYITPNTLIISSNANVASIVEDEFDDRNLTKALKASFSNNKIIGFKEKEQLLDIEKYENILIYSYDAYNDQNQKEVINEILQKHNNVYVISLKGPNDQKYFKGLVNYSCLYEYTPNSIRAVIRQLKQQKNLNGKLPK